MKYSSAAAIMGAATLGVWSGVVAVDTSTGSPVEKVVVLLRDMKARIESDDSQDAQAYNKFACWCEKTSARKAEAIETAQADLRTVGQAILQEKGEVATLTSEIEGLVADIVANKEAQEEATALRQKQNGEFVADSSEMKQVLVALEQAITVLVGGSKPTAFIQRTAATAGAAQAVIDTLPNNAQLKPKQLSLLTDLADQKAGYMPQSLTVQGILKDMYDTFSSDLESSLELEATRNRDFENFLSVKVAEFNTVEGEKAGKEVAKADAEQTLANNQQNYGDTDAQMKADIVFFDETKSACEAKHGEFETRSALRREELSGITQAIGILESDASRELFGKTIKPGKETGADASYNTGMTVSFLQEDSDGSADDTSPGAKAAFGAYNALKAHATKSHSLRLASLAVKARMAKVGHFAPVIAAIDEMIATLKSENLADIAKRNECKTEYKNIASTIAQTTWDIQKNDAKIDKLEGLIEQREEEKMQTVTQIADVDQMVQDMTATRQAENGAFLNSTNDDRQATALILEARDALMGYYSNHSISLGLIQGSARLIGADEHIQDPWQESPAFEVSVDQAPDAGFADQNTHAHETKGIVSLLTMIAQDLNDEIRNDMKAEESAQLEYEKQMAAAATLRQNLIDKKTNLETMIANRMDEKSAEELERTNNQQALSDKQDYKQTITPDCDWILKAFAERSQKRDVEMQGLTSAKEFLAGYMGSAAALLERRADGVADAPSLVGIRFLGVWR